MPETIVKTYQFKLSPGTSKPSFLALNQQMDELLLKMDGFVYRSLAETEGGEWLDIVYWSSNDAAGQAESLMGEKVMQSLMEAIDAESIKVQKASIATQVYPEMTNVSA